MNHQRVAEFQTVWHQPGRDRLGVGSIGSKHPNNWRLIYLTVPRFLGRQTAGLRYLCILEQEQLPCMQTPQALQAQAAKNKHQKP